MDDEADPDGTWHGDARMMGRIKDALRAHGDKLLFLLIGGLNTVFSLALYSLFVIAIEWMIRVGVLPAMLDWVQADIAMVTSWLFGVTFSWAMFKRFVFRTRGTNWVAEWARSYLVYLPSLIANLGALAALVGVFNLNKIVAQVLWGIVMAFYSWFAHKWFTFGTPKAGEPEPVTWEGE